MILNKEGILKAKDLPFKDVNVSEWLGKDAIIRLRVMTAKGKEIFETSCFNLKGKKVEWNQENYKMKLLMATIVDEKNNCIFDDKTGIAEISELNGLMIDFLYSEASELNGLSADEVEAEVKNSEADQT